MSNVSMIEIELSIKELIIEVLFLEDLSPDDIGSDELIFGDGMGLDSIDALELGVALRQKYDVDLDADTEDIREHFATVSNLARFITTSAKLGKVDDA